MNKIMIYTVKENEDKIKTEDFLKKQGLSSKIITKLKYSPNGITLDENQIYTTKILNSGDKVKIILPLTEFSENIVPVKLPFPIIFEDDDIVIINKPSNVPIHPSQGNFENTLANAAAFYYKEKGEAFVFRAINRLDRDTTGLLILAKNPISACILSKMMKERKIHRKYLAIVEGIIENNGTIDAPIARTCDSTIERCVDFEKGEKAITHYKVLENKKICLW